MHAAARDSHRRSSSLSVPLGDLHAGPELSAISRPLGTPNIVEADVFPPVRAQAPDPSIFLPYTTEDIAFEEVAYEFDNRIEMMAQEWFHRLDTYMDSDDPQCVFRKGLLQL